MPSDGGWSITHEVRLSGTRGVVPTWNAFDPPQPFEEKGLAMFRARLAAANISLHRCSATYNTVVLPAALVGRQGWLVYLLAATEKAGEWVLGGHYRALVSEDGSKVEDVSPLSRSCMTIDARSSPSRGKPVASYLTQFAFDWPAETLVFSSLLYRQPIYVLTKRGQWKVDGDRIDYWGP